MKMSKEQMFMEMAETVSKRSTCERLQVGSIITDADMRNVLAIGYNGNYAGGPNTCDTTEPGLCGCVHSEINSLIKCGYGSIMFVTDSPCEVCAKAIINAGIKRIFYKREYRITKGLDLLKKAGLKVEQIQ